MNGIWRVHDLVDSGTHYKISFNSCLDSSDCISSEAFMRDGRGQTLGVRTPIGVN